MATALSRLQLWLQPMRATLNCKRHCSSSRQGSILRKLKGFEILTRVLQEQQRQAERAHDNCRRDLQEQGATNEELNSEMQARLA